METVRDQAPRSVLLRGYSQEASRSLRLLDQALERPQDGGHDCPAEAGIWFWVRPDTLLKGSPTDMNNSITIAPGSRMDGLCRPVPISLRIAQCTCTSMARVEDVPFPLPFWPIRVVV